MNTLRKANSFGFILAAAAGLAVPTLTSHGQGATATINETPAGGGTFDYTILLQNTGSTSLNSFWYGWTSSGNNLPSDPANAGNSAGWDNDLDDNSIMWINNSGTTLGPGQSATFTFASTSSLSAITTSPSGESVAYVNGIDFSQDEAGDSTPMFSPTVGPVPEPSSLGLLAAGLLLAGGSWRWLATARKSPR